MRAVFVPEPLLAVEKSSWPITLLAIYCLIVAAASLGGGFAPFLLKLSHRRLQVVISLVAGLMLGVGAFHMLPHAVGEVGSVDRAVWWMMIGILLMFFMLRAFHFHQHGGPAEAEHGVHRHDHDHDHGHSHSHGPSTQSHAYSWLGIAFGLTVHTILDGVALATSVQVDARAGQGWLLGLPTFLVVALHKPIDAAAITSLMRAGGWNASARNGINFAFAMMVPLGALAFALGVGYLDAYQHQVVGCALAFSAGVFLCIALADLLPEIEFHSHDRLLLSAALLVGVIVAYAIGFLEPHGLHGSHRH